MQVVIEIGEEEYEKNKTARCDYHTLRMAIMCGTPLPNGHGRLVDVKEILDAYENSYKGTHADDLSAFLSDYVQTVVPAEKDGD